MDWYNKALEEFMTDAVIDTGVKRYDIEAVYNYLCNIGLVDYDIEKEFLYNTYVEDDESE